MTTKKLAERWLSDDIDAARLKLVRGEDALNAMCGMSNSFTYALRNQVEIHRRVLDLLIDEFEKLKELEMTV